MSDQPTPENSLMIPRRRLLKGAAAVGGLGTFLGQTAAQPSRPQRHIVGITPSSVSVNAVRSMADEVHRVLDFGDIGRAVAGRFTSQALTTLESRSDVRYVEPDGTMHAIAQTLPWGIDRVDAEIVHASGRTGEGAHIAIIDTGIDSDHPDLQANLGTGYAAVNCASGDCLEPWDDDNEHGTHCAGIADAIDNTEGVVGVSTQATLHAVKVLNEFGNGSWSDIAEGIRWTADQGYDVASMSLGGSSYSFAVADACLYAYNRDVLLVAAAGNNGPCSDCVDYPAEYSTVIAVSSTDSSDALSSFSSTGPEVELAAPGSSIYSTVPGGYDTNSGTSMACPHVSGAAGQLMALGFTNEEARTQLRSTAENIGLSTNEQGFGLLDVEAAVPGPIGEVGSVTTNQPDAGTWHTVSLQETYDDPAVIMKPASYDGRHPGHVRLRNVSASSFEFKFEEWEYLDGGHTAETFHYVVMERGVHRLADGTNMVAGYLDGFDHTFSSASYGYTFDSPPVVLSQPQTFNGIQPIVSRLRNVTTSSVEIRVQEEEGLDGSHAGERVGAIVIEPGDNSFFGTPFEMGRTPNTVTHEWYQIDFDQTYDDPMLLADMQTFDGSHTAGLRYRNLTGSSVEVFVEEEQSADDETFHTSEVVGYMVVESAPAVFDGKTGVLTGTTTSGSDGLSSTGDAGAM